MSIAIFFYLIGDLYCKEDSCGTKAPFDVDNSDDCCHSREKNVSGIGLHKKWHVE